MAPVAQVDIDPDTHTSDVGDSQDSPLRRHFSEPIHHSDSITASQSPTPFTHQSKCGWCGKYFESFGEHSASHAEAFKEHMATVHPHIAKFSMYDGSADEALPMGDVNNVSERGDDEQSEPAVGAVEEANGDESANELDDAVEGDEGDDGEAVEEDLVEADEGEGDEEGEDEEVGVAEAGEEPHEEQDAAPSSQLHESSPEQDTASMEKRVRSFWNVNEVTDFSPDYDEEMADLEHTWDSIFNDPKRGKKREASEILERPDPYKKAKVAVGEFLELTPAESFLSQLRDPENRSPEELYAITANVAHALKVWQDEHAAIDKLTKRATRNVLHRTVNPRKTENKDVFEDKKEAMLYGYKHLSSADKLGNQDPFAQGGFVPTPAQLRKLAATPGSKTKKPEPTTKDPNPDGFASTTKFGIEHIPKPNFINWRLLDPKAAKTIITTTTRKRTAAQMEAANKANETEEASPDTAAAPETEQEASTQPAKRTRTRGGRQATTTENAHIQTAPSSPVPTRGSGRGRGRGRGRGGRVPSRGVSATPQPPTSVPPLRTSGRGQGRGAMSSRAPTNPVPLQAVLDPAAPTAPQPKHAPIAPASNASAAPAATRAASSSASTDLDAERELARQQKIANSKNPKRTEAMLNHWQRFNREGRVRNPKRTKAQIEAARLEEAAKKAAEGPKTGGRKRKGVGTTTTTTAATPTPTSNIDTAGAPAMQPAPKLAYPQPASLANNFPPASQIHPYGPMNPGALAPNPFSSGPSLGSGHPIPPPPQQIGYHHSPYADYFVNYGGYPMPASGEPRRVPGPPPRPA